MPTQDLDYHPVAVLNGLKDSRLINGDHHDLSMGMLTERDVSTEYDMLNLLTDSAKGIRSLARRQYAEGQAMRVGMQGGGYSGVIDGGYNKKYASTQFNNIRGND